MIEARTPEITRWCEILGVSPSAGPVVIKAAGKALLISTHPDKAANDSDRGERLKRAQEITEAVAELCDPRNAPLTKAPPSTLKAQHAPRRPAPGPTPGPTPKAQSAPKRPAPGPFPFAHRAAVSRRATISDLAQILEFDLMLLLFLANRSQTSVATITALTELTPLLEKEITSAVKEWTKRNY